MNVPNIPALPTGLPPAPSGGPDPTIFIPNVQANPGDSVTVPVELTVTESAGITVSGFQVAIAYDPTVFTVSAVAQLGSMFSSSLGFSPVPDLPRIRRADLPGLVPDGDGHDPLQYDHGPVRRYHSP